MKCFLLLNVEARFVCSGGFRYNPAEFIAHKSDRRTSVRRNDAAMKTESRVHHHVKALMEAG
jgi:hypothetical protein